MGVRKMCLLGKRQCGDGDCGVYSWYGILAVEADAVMKLEVGGFSTILLGIKVGPVFTSKIAQRNLEIN
jgi:hypothetical protein